MTVMVSRVFSRDDFFFRDHFRDEADGTRCSRFESHFLLVLCDLYIYRLHSKNAFVKSAVLTFWVRDIFTSSVVLCEYFVFPSQILSYKM